MIDSRFWIFMPVFISRLLITSTFQIQVNSVKVARISTGADKAADAVEEAVVHADEAARGEEEEAAEVEGVAVRSRNPTSSRSSRR